MPHPLSKMVETEYNKGADDGRITDGQKLPVRDEGAPSPTAAPSPEPTSAEAQAPPQPAQVAVPEEKTEGDIFGKYKSMEEADKGYWEQQTTLTRTIAERNALQNQLAAMQGTTPGGVGQAATLPGGTPGARERANPIAERVDWRSNERVVKAAEGMGADPDALGQFAEEITGEMQNRMTGMVDQAVQAQLAPHFAQAEANAYMAQKYPEAPKFAQEVQNFVQSDPALLQEVQGLLELGQYKSASKIAYREYKDALDAQSQQSMKANEQVAEENRMNQRAQAGLPASPKTPVHAEDPSNQAPDPKYIAELAEAYKNGDMAAGREWRRLTFLSEPRLKEKLAQIANEGTPLMQ